MNKEVCKKCVLNNGWWWSDQQDLEWKYDCVYCPDIGRGTRSSRNISSGKAPDDCKYKLEHLILSEA